MKTKLLSVCALLALLITNPVTVPVTEGTDRSVETGEAVKAAMGKLEISKESPKILVLTKAYYGQMDGKSAKVYRGVISDTNGCTSGKRNFIDVHTAFNKPLWFALFSKETNKIVFVKRDKGKFESIDIDASPETILTVEGWKKALEDLIDVKSLFSVVSISLAWSKGAAWQIIKTAGFHDHLCPGVNIGYLAYIYLEKNLPLKKGEKHLFFGALPKCYMDAFQAIYNTTLGKQTAYGVTMTKEQLDKYKTNGVVPSIIAMKVNKKKGTCQGVVLGHSWNEIMDDLGLQVADFSPKGGPANPVFFLTRAIACTKMAQIELKEKMKWIKELRQFSGDAGLVKKICNAGGDPYEIVWAQ